MSGYQLSLKEIEALSLRAFTCNGCDSDNADALVRTIVAAERDGAAAHGLFRVPGYIAALRSGAVNGRASPSVKEERGTIVRVDGDNGYAPLAQERGLPALVETARRAGVAAMVITNTRHFAALWPETEYLASHGLAALACVNNSALVAPFGGKVPLFGTNPISFAWPRPGRLPLAFDFATSSMAHGAIQIAARRGIDVPAGTGLDSFGNATTDPEAVLAGTLLPFGGYKGSAISLMVELLSAAAIGECFSFEADTADVGAGGPTRGGELILAFSPASLAGGHWAEQSERFFDRFGRLDGARLPGSRRHAIRRSGNLRRVDADLVAEISGLCIE